MKKSDTQMIKGLAICILLFHHLFYSTQPGLGIMIGDKYLANIVAEYLKVCVALFLVLSGYGLNASMTKISILSLNFIRNIYGRFTKIIGLYGFCLFRLV